MDAAVGDAVGAGRSSSTVRASAKRFFALRHLGAHAVAGQGARRRRRRSRRPGRRPARRRRASRSRARAARRAWPRAAACRWPLTSRVFSGRRAPGSPVCAPARPAADLFARLLDQPFELLEQRVGLSAAAFDQVGEHLLGVAAGHPAALDGVVDDLLQAVAAQRDAALEAVAELLDALVEAAGRFAAGCFRRLFRRAFSRFRFGGFFRRRFFARLWLCFAAAFALAFGFRRLSLFCRFAGCFFLRHLGSPPESVAAGAGPTISLRSSGGSAAANRASTGAWSERRRAQPVERQLAALGRPGRRRLERPRGRGRAGGRSRRGAVGAAEAEALARAARRPRGPRPGAG